MTPSFPQVSPLTSSILTCLTQSCCHTPEWYFQELLETCNWIAHSEQLERSECKQRQYEPRAEVSSSKLPNCMTKIPSSVVRIELTRVSTNPRPSNVSTVSPQGLPCCQIFSVAASSSSQRVQCNWCGLFDKTHHMRLHVPVKITTLAHTVPARAIWNVRGCRLKGALARTLGCPQRICRLPRFWFPSCRFGCVCVCVCVCA